MTSRMSKITFRADDHLIEQLDEFDASKSEVMREALREFLGECDEEPPASQSEETIEAEDSIDEMLVDRVDAIIEKRLDQHLDQRRSAQSPKDVNVNITLDGENAVSGASSNERADASHEPGTSASHARQERKTDTPVDENTATGARKTCGQCGENLTSDHVYCPNCGEKASHRVFCDCGDELRSDWGFCPGCGRRTPAADVLDNT